MTTGKVVGVLTTSAVSAWSASLALYGKDAIYRTYPFWDGICFGVALILAIWASARVTGREIRTPIAVGVAAVGTFLLYVTWLIVLMA